MREEQNAAVARGYNMTAEQSRAGSQVYKEIKQAINIMDFATEKLGWQVDPERQDNRGVVLKHAEHGNITVPRERNPKSGNWGFYWTDKKGGGNLIDLLRESEWQWDEIRALKSSLSQEQQVVSQEATASTSLSKPPYEQRRVQDPEKQTELAQKRFSEFKSSTASSCLDKQGIDRQMYAAFPQVKTNEKEAAFMLYNVVEGRAHFCSTAVYRFYEKGQSNHFFQRDLPRGLVVLKDEGPVERLVVSESPVNALSFKQAETTASQEQAPPTMYISTCGNLTKSIREDMAHLFKTAQEQGQSVVLTHSDKEEEKQISQELASIADEQGVNARVSIPPAGNDWNEYLHAHKNQAANQQQVQGEAVSFHRPAYKGTLLEQLEISEKACQGIKGYEAGEKQITFPLYADSEAVKEKKSIGSYQFKLEEKGLVGYTEARGTTPGLVVLPARKSPDSVVITSSPMDIFLHRAEHQRPDITYISTCGQESKSLQQPLKDILSQHKGTKVVFYMPDEEANTVHRQLDKHFSTEHRLAYQVQPPQKALWHESPHKEGQDMHQVVKEEQWQQITPRQSQNKGITMQWG